MELKGFYLLVKEAVNEGAEKAVRSQLHLSESITKSDAYRCYGRANVDRWLQEGLLKPVLTKGSKFPKHLDRKKLAAIAAGSNRMTYLPVAER